MTTRTLARLVPLALCAALLAGCGDDDEPDPRGGTEPTYDAIAPSDDATSPGGAPPGDDESRGNEGPLPPDGSGTTAPEDPDDDTPPGAAELCAAFDDAFAAFEATGSDDFPQGSDPVQADLLEALRTWGEDLADAEQPDDLTDDQAAGIAVMSRLLLALPDEATGDDLEALEDDLSASEDRQVEAAGDYVEQTCDSSFF